MLSMVIHELYIAINYEPYGKYYGNKPEYGLGLAELLQILAFIGVCTSIDIENAE